MTALAVIKLVEQGKLDLVTRAIPYLGLKPLPISASIGENITSITVRQLLHHISGLRNGFPDWRMVSDATGKPGDKLTDEDYLRYMIQFPTDTRPGTVYAYSNSGYVLLGLLIAKASGTSYEEYVTKELLAPLGMKNTFMGVMDGQSNIARGETQYLEIGQPDPFQDRVVLRLSHPAGGWVSSVFDLARLVGFLSHNMVLNSPISCVAVQSLATRPPIPNEAWGYYGYGFFIHELPARGGVRLSHAGLHLNAYGYFFIDPEGMAVAVLLNSNETSQTVFNKELIPRLLNAAPKLANRLRRSG